VGGKAFERIILEFSPKEISYQIYRENKMAIPGSSFHARSISLPSKSQQHDANIKDYLRTRRATEAGPSSSSSFIHPKLLWHHGFVREMNNLIHLQHN